MLTNKIKIFFSMVMLSGLALAAEPGSGYYAKECAHPGGGYNIIINKDGTATVETDPTIYEKVMTSYSFFGNDTPSDFLVAIMFDAKNSPLPAYKGQAGWIEIWKRDNGYYALENGRASKELKLCSSNSTSDAAPAKSVKGFDKTLRLQGLTFHVTAPNEGSLTEVTIATKGLTGVNEVIKKEVDGMVTGAEVADLNKDGFPEVYVYITSAGSGSYASLLAYASNRNKSITEIYLPPLEEDKEASKGYMGHDKFAITENSLLRRFPIYKKEDPNCCPTGGTRQLEYKLKAGEAGWVLKLAKSADLKK